MPERTFFLKSEPPVRAFAIAAALSLLGGTLLVLGLQRSWSVVVIVVCALALVAGIVLFAAGVVAMSRLGVTVTLDDHGYRVSGTGQQHEGKWADVTKVTQAVGGAHITIYHGNVRRTHLIFPGGRAQLQLADVVDEIMARLQANKR